MLLIGYSSRSFLLIDEGFIIKLSWIGNLKVCLNQGYALGIFSLAMALFVFVLCVIPSGFYLILCSLFILFILQ